MGASAQLALVHVLILRLLQIARTDERCNVLETEWRPSSFILFHVLAACRSDDEVPERLQVLHWHVRGDLRPAALDRQL